MSARAAVEQRLPRIVRVLTFATFPEARHWIFSLSRGSGIGRGLESVAETHGDNITVIYMIERLGENIQWVTRRTLRIRKGDRTSEVSRRLRKQLHFHLA